MIENEEKAYWKAHALLAREFQRTLQESPYLPISTPCAALDERPLVDVALSLIDADEDRHLLAHMLRCVVRLAHEGDTLAGDVVNQLVRSHATHYADMMREQGQFEGAR